MKKFFGLFIAVVCVLFFGSVTFTGCSCNEAEANNDDVKTNNGVATNITLKCYYNDGTYRYYSLEIKAGAEIPFKNIYRDGYYIDNWHIGGPGGELLFDTATGEQKPLTKSTELLARWRSLSYNDPNRLSPNPPDGYVVVKYFMNFSSDDNNTFVNDYLEIGSTLASFQDPRNVTNDGKIFRGWYTDRSCSEDYKFTFSNTPITENLDLYAKWGKLS